MRTCGFLAAVVAVCGLASTPERAEACGRRRVVWCAAPVYCPPACPPCHVCCPPDETPLNPLPAHPVPHTLVKHTLTLKNDSACQSYAIIYMQHPDGVYRVYDKTAVSNTPVVLNPDRYFANDHLLIQTWTRKAPTGSHAPADHWHCRCNHLVTLVGATGTFDVVGCGYTHP
jgi:hypothetical protein